MKGAVIFAQNNSKIDYIKMAVYSASKVIEHLDIPVSVVTDDKNFLLSKYPDNPFDQIIEIPKDSSTQVKKFSDGALASTMLEWKNSSRGQIYNLSPYEKTLVIDSDYIINSSILKPALDNDQDLQLYKSSFDLAGWKRSNEFDRITQYSIPFYWATVFVFQKNVFTEAFFNIVVYIKSNWHYYRMLYNIESNNFRNDFAFSIAIHIMNGSTNGTFATNLPGTMVYTLDKDVLVSTDANKMKFLVEKKNHLGEYTLVKTHGLDVHVMNKSSLTRFIDGGSGV